MSIQFSGTGFYVMQANNDAEFPALKTTGPHGKTIPVFIPDRVSPPALHAFLQVQGKVTLNKKNFLILVVDRWENLNTGEESKYLPKEGGNTDFPPDSAPPRM